MPSQCTIPECQRPARTRRMCAYHYRAWWRTSDFQRIAPLPRTIDQRFWEKVCISENCWEWKGTKSRGYGKFRITSTRKMSAHRWAYLRYVGPIPAGLELDHLCRNPPCIRFDHLEPVTSRQNSHRSPLHQANQEVCKWGHPFERQTATRRVCIQCARRRRKAFRQRYGR